MNQLNGACNVSKIGTWIRAISAIRHALFFLNITFLKLSSCVSARVVHFLAYTRVRTSYHLLTRTYCFILCIDTLPTITFLWWKTSFTSWMVAVLRTITSYPFVSAVLFRLSHVLPSSRYQTVHLNSRCFTGDAFRIWQVSWSRDHSFAIWDVLSSQPNKTPVSLRIGFSWIR